eukprot:410414-Pelagomonas_calceolata.AAC.2
MKSILSVKSAKQIPAPVKPTNLSMRDLCLNPLEQPLLSMCWGVPRVWGQKSGKITAKMGSPGLPDRQG